MVRCFFFFSFFHSNHNTISRLRPRQKMQRHREGLLCEWRRLLLHTWYKSALLQVSYLLCFCIHLEKLHSHCQPSLSLNENSLHDVFTLIIFLNILTANFYPAVYFPDSTWFPFFFLSAAAATHHRKRLPVCLTTHLLCILTLIMERGGGALILLSHV